ncbi:MAG: M48 family metallopeptidase [Alphaproteobacteria bacterium]|nr:M48 family metallopeptidase [Alphaproteobacteria bacterium]
MKTQTIPLAGRDVAYTLKRSRRRTIGFSIGADGLSVTAPTFVGQADIDAALHSKSGWILSKLDKWAERPAPRQPNFESGENLPWLGSERVLIVEPRGVRTRAKLEADAIRISIDPMLEGDLRAATVRNGLARLYKAEGHKLMAPKVEAYAGQLGKRVARTIVREQKSRWGSCAPDGTIRLNWRLMGFPEPLIDYVCAHEAAHLVEANHSPAYWAVVERLMPDWKARRKSMREDAHLWTFP